MMFKRTGLGLFFIILTLISACGGNETATPISTPTHPLESAIGSSTNVAEGVVKGDPVDLGPGFSIEIKTPTPTPAGTVEPIYGSVIIKSSTVTQPAGSPTPTIRIQGLLPTPCHKLIIKMDPVVDKNIISIHVLSSALLQVRCTQKYQPFDQTIRLTDIPRGKYVVWINGNSISTVTIQ